MAVTSQNTGSPDHGSMLAQEAQMFELLEIVIPNIKTHWQDLAYCMRYTIGEVEAFNRDGKDLSECCIKLFNNWLTTDHGPRPKTYETLLKHIKKISNLTSVSEAIEKKLTEGRLNKKKQMKQIIDCHKNPFLDIVTTLLNIGSNNGRN